VTGITGSRIAHQSSDTKACSDAGLVLRCARWDPVRFRAKRRPCRVVRASASILSCRALLCRSSSQTTTCSVLSRRSNRQALPAPGEASRPDATAYRSRPLATLRYLQAARAADQRWYLQGRWLFYRKLDNNKFHKCHF
jgi:hypothetical protein